MHTFYKLGCGLNHLFALKYCYLIHSVVLIVVSSKRENKNSHKKRVNAVYGQGIAS